MNIDNANLLPVLVEKKIQAELEIDKMIHIESYKLSKSVDMDQSLLVFFVLQNMRTICIAFCKSMHLDFLKIATIRNSLKTGKFNEDTIRTFHRIDFTKIVVLYSTALSY